MAALTDYVVRQRNFCDKGLHASHPLVPASIAYWVSLRRRPSCGCFVAFRRTRLAVPAQRSSVNYLQVLTAIWLEPVRSDGSPDQQRNPPADARRSHFDQVCALSFRCGRSSQQYSAAFHRHAPIRFMAGKRSLVHLVPWCPNSVAERRSGARLPDGSPRWCTSRGPSPA
jgi:hypothetical protein